jgi:hypothetical protein
MTSVIRSTTVGRSLPAVAQFVPMMFTNTFGYDQPFPWRYDKKTQFLDLEFVDGFTASSGTNDNDLYFRGQDFSACSLVLGLGPNFIEWCQTTENIAADPGTVQLHEAPIVVKANMVAPRMAPDDGGTQESEAVISFESAAGTEAGKYCRTLIFMKPLVIKYKRSGNQYYRWFNQNFDGNT